MINMKQLSSSLLFSVVTFLISTQQVNGSNYLSVSSYSCSSNTGVAVTDFSLDCDQCAFGSKVEITADLYFSQDQSENVQATIWLSKAYISFLTIINQQDIDICKATESNDDGSECPSAGSYTVSTDLEIPEYNGWVTSFQTHLVMTDADDGTTMLACTATISGGYQMYMMTGMAALGGLVLVGVLMGRKYGRRVVTAGSGSRGVDDLATSFEMMTDPSEGVMGGREGVVKPGVIV